MRAAILPLLIGIAPVFALACSSSAGVAPDAGSSSSSGGGSGSSSGGNNDGGPQSGAFTQYSPVGCSYSYSPPSRLNFQNLAYDDQSPVSATAGVPERVRLGLGGGVTKGQAGYADPTTSAAFTWETSESNHAAKVKLGTSATSMTTVQAGYTWTTPASLGPAANMHEVHVCGLQPGTQYFYQVGGGPSASEVWSATQTFMTETSSGTVSIGIFGDARDNVSVWQLVHKRMKEAAVGMMLVPGDVILTGADEGEYVTWLDSIWKDPSDSSKFLTLGQQIILPVNGNHENDTPDSFGAWALPGVAGDTYAETYASFDVGAVHFVLVDDQQISTVGGGNSSPEATAQLAWLDGDLKAADADRKNHPFIVVLSHRGIFSTSNHAGDGDVLNTRGQLAPLFDKYKVDLSINGHDHEYERSKPLHAGNPASGAPVVGAGTVYVINAGAGADPYAINSSPQSYSSGVQVTFCGGGAACSTSPYVGTYSIFSVSPTSLKMTAYGMKLSSTSYMDDTVIDTLTMTPQ
jgi:hypothetical protein